jgi:hypothetical protein
MEFMNAEKAFQTVVLYVPSFLITKRLSTTITNAIYGIKTYQLIRETVPLIRKAVFLIKKTVALITITAFLITITVFLI